MTAHDAANVVEAVEMVVEQATPPAEVPTDYQIADCSARTVRFIVSTYRRLHQWSGVRVHSREDAR
jgi:UDP-N-acetylglucosamine 2-epimerase (non-hydrolysing)